MYDYVKSCMEETSKDVLFTMGIQGGYVDIPKKIVQTSPVTCFRMQENFEDLCGIKKVRIVLLRMSKYKRSRENCGERYWCVLE